MNIWHLENKCLTQLILWRTEENHFRVTQRGDFVSLIKNPNYILIEKKFKNILQNISDQVIFTPAIITDYFLKTESQNYLELNLVNAIDPETIKTENTNGVKLWSAGSELFVSHDLKNILIEIDPNAFEFNLGFSHFAGQ